MVIGILPATGKTHVVKFNLWYLAPICLVATLGGLLIGYDNGVISGAIEPLTAKFGLSAAMKGWVAASVMIGGAVGVMFAGTISDRYGRKKALLVSGVLFIVSSLGAAIAPSVNVFVVFRFFGGLAMGIPSICTPMYIAEITPANLRGRLVTVNQIAIVSGFTIVYFANYFIARSGDQAWIIQSAWRWMFASCLLPATMFGVLLLFVPESPRWLVEKKREDAAYAIFQRIGGAAFGQAELTAVRAALNQEQGTWRELFSSALVLPLVLGILLAILQQITGINVFMTFGATVFKDIGQSTGVDAGLIQQFVIGVASIVFTLVAITMVDKWGRRPLMFLGTSGMFITLVSMGIMAQTMNDPAEAGVLMLICIIAYIACFNLSAGPIIWVLLSEIYPTAIRGRALGVAIFCMWIANFSVIQTFPLMNSGAWLVKVFHHAFPFYVYAAFCIILLVVMHFCPETKGKSLEEIELWWRHRNTSDNLKL